MAPFSGSRSMAIPTTGNQATAIKQLTLPATSSATMNCTMTRRPIGARAKLATPPKVIGCHDAEDAGVPMVERGKDNPDNKDK
jgi:hypothetical protein